MPVSFVDFEKVKVNSGGDQELLRELIKMGLERINSSLAEMEAMVAGQDWDGLSRTIHKLRPILCYAGIETFNTELIGLEKDAREKTGLAEMPARIGKITGNLHLARCELEHLLSELQE
jgi:HPt (histidine-containing phosphotransfer) domain-containing protein